MRAVLAPYLASVLCGIRLCLRRAVDDDDNDKDEVAVVPPRCPQAESSFRAWSSDAVARLKLPRVNSLRTGEQPMRLPLPLRRLAWLLQFVTPRRRSCAETPILPWGTRDVRAARQFGDCWPESSLCGVCSLLFFSFVGTGGVSSGACDGMLMPTLREDTQADESLLATASPMPRRGFLSGASGADGTPGGRGEVRASLPLCRLMPNAFKAAAGATAPAHLTPG